MSIRKSKGGLKRSFMLTWCISCEPDLNIIHVSLKQNAWPFCWSLFPFPVIWIPNLGMQKISSQPVEHSVLLCFYGELTLNTEKEDYHTAFFFCSRVICKKLLPKTIYVLMNKHFFFFLTWTNVIPYKEIRIYI